MNDDQRDDQWDSSSFGGSRRAQLRQAQSMSVRQRLEALDQLRQLSDRMQTMPRQYAGASITVEETAVREPVTDYNGKQALNEIVLSGCTPTPLANYLKALGVLRLLSTRHPGTRARWRGDKLVLHTSLSRDGLERFFLDEYEPTPVMAPWNGGSGFYEKDNKQALQTILSSQSSRLAAYGHCLDIAETVLAGLDRSASPKGEDKTRLLSRMRAALPDAALAWFDASVVLSGESAQYPPLLGTGGNDGRLDFTNNFMQRLCDVLPVDEEVAAPQESAAWLRMALFGEPAPGLQKRAIGQFSPGQAGGPNGSSGFEADSLVNSWDFVLMIEGALPFAAAAVRRNADDPFGVLSYPFTVRAVGAGAGNIGLGDSANARGELWMPLWERPAAYMEIHALLSEGRVALGRKPARDALDFVRALHHLGGYRGVRSFQRFGLLMRSGKAYLATPLGRVDVQPEPSGRWVDDLDAHDWLSRFRRYAQGEQVPAGVKSLCRRLDDLLFRVSAASPLAGDVQALIILLGEIQRVIAVSPKAMEAVPPVPKLTEQWVQLAGDDTPAFRIVRALAGLHGTADKPLPIRSQLAPVHPRWRNVWITPEYAGKHANDPACGRRLVTPRRGQLAEFMSDLLMDRLRLGKALAMLDKPLNSPSGVTLEDITAFLIDDAMDRQIMRLLPGLALCEIPLDAQWARGDGLAPTAYALARLCLTPDAILAKLRCINEGEQVRIPPALIASLRRGNTFDRGVALAWRRLHASRLAPAMALPARPTLGSTKPVRLTAALLIPLRSGATGALAQHVLKPRRDDDSTHHASNLLSNNLETSP